MGGLRRVAPLCYIKFMAAKTKTVRARVEPKLKRGAEAGFKKIGLKPSEAVTLFYKRVELTRGIPFEMRIPNKETRRAIAQARAGKGLKTFKNFDAFARYIRSI